MYPLRPDLQKKIDTGLPDAHRAQTGPPRSRRPFYRRIRARAQTKAFSKEIIFHLEKNWIFQFSRPRVATANLYFGNHRVLN